MATLLTIGAATQLTHAAVQVIADDAGLDVLHIKGPALDQSLRWTPEGITAEESTRSSTDADVWVRPKHLNAMRAALERHGWTVAYHFDDGSPFRHAMTLVHPHFAPLDLHRQFPGIREDAEQAFDVLWGGRTTSRIAGIECPVPDLTAQRLILLLHAVRARKTRDIVAAYSRATNGEQEQVWRLAHRLGAEVPLAAATGTLAAFRDRREYGLWRAIQDGERSRARMWVARVKAEPTLRKRFVTGVHLVAPKADRLQATLGRRPTAADRARDLARTARIGATEILALLGRRGRR